MWNVIKKIQISLHCLRFIMPLDASNVFLILSIWCFYTDRDIHTHAHTSKALGTDVSWIYFCYCFSSNCLSLCVFLFCSNSCRQRLFLFEALRRFDCYKWDCTQWLHVGSEPHASLNEGIENTACDGNKRCKSSVDANIHFESNKNKMSFIICLCI